MSVQSAATAVHGAFTATTTGWKFAGTLTMDDAADVFAVARALPLPQTGNVDLAQLQHADSSALAVLLALQRRARHEHRTLTFLSVPPMLQALARVYGIEDLIIG
jgi:phospholipid transport system transporter-binding protein